MHPYTTDSNERKVIPLYIAVLSILAALGLNRALVATQLSLPWWIDAPSILGFYGLFYATFDKYLWRWRLLRTVRIVKVPDLNGTWKGYYVSSFDSPAKQDTTTLRISQKWTQISITLETRYSKSHSLIAGIITESPEGFVLSYEYMNEPTPDAKNTMHIHRGTARLAIQAGGKALEGEYYSGRDRQNIGTLRLERYDNPRK